MTTETTTTEPSALGGEAPPIETPAETTTETKPLSETLYGKETEPQTGDKPATETKPEGEKGEGEGALTLESYKDLSFPEEFTPDEALLGKFKESALKSKISPQAAQELMGLYTDAMKEAAARNVAENTKIQADWLKEVNAMPEFQGDRKATTLNFLGRAMDEFGTPELKKYLNETGLGNHPGLVKMIHDMAVALVEDEPPLAGRPANNGRDGRPRPTGLAEILYPST